MYQAEKLVTKQTHGYNKFSEEQRRQLEKNNP